MFMLQPVRVRGLEFRVGGRATDDIQLKTLNLSKEGSG